MSDTRLVKAMAVIAMFATTFFTCVPNTASKTYATRVKNVAVVETEIDAQSGASAEMNPAEVRLMTAGLRREAVENLPRDKYNIMTSETVIAQGSAVLEECFDENCVITLGSKIGADYIVRGNISKVGTELTLSVEMYETENGNLVASSEFVSSEKTAELLKRGTAACGEMYRKFENPKMTSSKPKPDHITTQTVYHTTAPPNQLSWGGSSGSTTDERDGKKYKMTDHAKQIQAFVNTGNAYFNMQNFKESESNYNKAIKIYEQHKKTSNINVADVAQAYFMIGEIFYKKFEDIKLTAKNEKEMAGVLKQKTKALEEPAKYFAKAIELGVVVWTMRATYMIGKGFYDMAEAVANQTLFGNEVEKMGGKIKVLSSLDKYYDKAMEYFGQNIAWAKEQNLKGEYIEMSMQAMMEMAYKKGDILEQVGLIFKNSPVPKELQGEERELYVMELEMRYFRAQDAAMPVYEDGMKLAKEIGIANSPWIDRIRRRLAVINPTSKWKDVQITEWEPK
jgi:tetratricopeptide (TPR) repeat protein